MVDAWICVSLRLKKLHRYASLRARMRARINDSAMMFLLGSLGWTANSTDASKLIIISYVTRRNAFAGTACLAINYLMDLPEFAHSSRAIGFGIRPLYKLTYTWKSPRTV